MNKIIFLILLTVGLQLSSNAASFSRSASKSISGNYLSLNVTDASVSSDEADDPTGAGGSDDYGSKEDKCDAVFISTAAGLGWGVVTQGLPSSLEFCSGALGWAGPYAVGGCVGLGMIFLLSAAFSASYLAWKSCKGN